MGAWRERRRVWEWMPDLEDALKGQLKPSYLEWCPAEVSGVDVRTYGEPTVGVLRELGGVAVEERRFFGLSSGVVALPLRLSRYRDSRRRLDLRVSNKSGRGPEKSRINPGSLSTSKTASIPIEMPNSGGWKTHNPSRSDKNPKRWEAFRPYGRVRCERSRRHEVKAG